MLAVNCAKAALTRKRKTPINANKRRDGMQLGMGASYNVWPAGECRHSGQPRENVYSQRLMYKYYAPPLSRTFLEMTHASKRSCAKTLRLTTPTLVRNNSSRFTNCYELICGNLFVLFVQPVRPIHINVGRRRCAKPKM